jgi:hypothetical protein
MSVSTACACRDGVWEGLPDYVAIENRETFEQLRDALGGRPDDDPTRVKYGSYPRYRLLVTYFIEKRGLVFPSAFADEADGKRGNRTYAGGRKAMRLFISVSN